MVVSIDMEAAHFQHLALVLTHLSDANIEWAEVAKERGVSRKDNAATQFKTVMKQYGLEFKNKKFSRIAGFDTAAEEGAGSAPKPRKPRTPRKRKSEDDSNDGDQGQELPAKKQKSKTAGQKTGEVDSNNDSKEDGGDGSD